MQIFRFAAGDTSKTIDVFLLDSSSATGDGLAGLVFNSAGLAAYYRNAATGTVTAITLATQTVGGAWASGGFVELDATHAKGMYRLDIPDAALAAGGEGFIFIYGATNLAPTPIQISVGYVPVNAALISDTVWDEVLTAATHNVASSAGRRLRQINVLTSVDSTVNDAAATTTSFVTALTSAVDNFYDDQLLIFTSGSLAGQASPVLSYNGTTKAITLSEALTSAPANGDGFTLQATHIHPVSQIASGVWQDSTAGDFAVASSIGKSLYTSGNAPGAASGISIVGSAMTLTNAGIDALFTRQLTESYAADGAAPTVAQALMLIMQVLTEMSITGTTVTVKKLDGTTTALTLSLDSATTPTSTTRAT